MKPKKLFSIILASGVLFAAGCAAPGEVHSPASSEGATTSQPAVSSQMPVSSAPVSSAPASSKPSPVSSSPVLPDDYKPAVSLNLSFDPRVYVETFNNEGYFNQKDQFICWADVGKNTTVPTTKTEVVKGKHLNFYYYPENSPKYKKWMQTELNSLDLIQVSGEQWFEEYNRNNVTTLSLYGLRENGTPYYPREISGIPEEQARIDEYLKTVNAWRDLVYFTSVYGDAVGLKKDGTVLHAPDHSHPTKFQEVFHPEEFHDIVAIARDDQQREEAFEQHLYLLRKDGVLFNARGEVLYEQVERLIPSSIYNSPAGAPHYIMRSSGEVICLNNGQSVGTAKDKEKIVKIDALGCGVYALMEDGSFQIIRYSNPDDDYYAAMLHNSIQKVTDCKTN